jgi:hypothetical protein
VGQPSVPQAEPSGLHPRGCDSRWNRGSCLRYALPAVFTGTGAANGAVSFKSLALRHSVGHLAAVINYPSRFCDAKGVSVVGIVRVRRDHQCLLGAARDTDCRRAGATLHRQTLRGPRRPLRPRRAPRLCTSRGNRCRQRFRIEDPCNISCNISRLIGVSGGHPGTTPTSHQQSQERHYRRSEAI